LFDDSFSRDSFVDEDSAMTRSTLDLAALFKFSLETFVVLFLLGSSLILSSVFVGTLFLLPTLAWLNLDLAFGFSAYEIDGVALVCLK
jgi:hypothetical protein